MRKIVVVDENDLPTGAEERSIVYVNGLIHRIARIFVFNSQNELYLQFRGPKMDIAPNTWDQSAGGHVNEQETYQMAAKRELQEELGIKDASLEFITKYYHEEPLDGLTLKRFNAIFKTEFAGTMVLNLDEISKGTWLSLSDIQEKMTQHPSQFAAGFCEAYNRYKQIEG